MVGSDVQLRCIYPEKNSFDLNDLYVYWQISMAGKGNVDSVVTYHLSGTALPATVITTTRTGLGCPWTA